MHVACARSLLRCRLSRMAEPLDKSMEVVGEDGADDGAARRTPSWLPPAADAAGEYNLFGRDFETHFWVPQRLTDKSTELVETANDFHYAMVNDHPRNDFYRQSLAAVVNSDTHVLEIGTGSGLLAMIAAKQGGEVRDCSRGQSAHGCVGYTHHRGEWPH